VWRSEIPRPAQSNNTKTFDETFTTTNAVTGVATSQSELSETTPENSLTKQELTIFHDVEQPRVALPIAPQTTSSLAKLDATATIVDFLSRTVVLDQFELVQGKSNDNHKPLNPATFKDPQPAIRQYSLPGDILKLGGKLDKANNHQYFKADCHIKLVLNTNPMVAGRFWLTYSPYEKKVDKARRQQYNSRAGVTAYPGIEIDVQINDTAEMVIPFASYKEAYDLNTPVPEDFVTLSLYGITDLLAKNGENYAVGITILAWFENVTINLPTIKNIPYRELPQTNTNHKKDRIDAKLALLEKKNPSAYKYITNILDIRPGRMQTSWGSPSQLLIKDSLDLAPVLHEIESVLIDVCCSVRNRQFHLKPLYKVRLHAMQDLLNSTLTNIFSRYESLDESSLISEDTPDNVFLTIPKYITSLKTIYSTQLNYAEMQQEAYDSKDIDGMHNSNNQLREFLYEVKRKEMLYIMLLDSYYTVNRENRDKRVARSLAQDLLDERDAVMQVQKEVGGQGLITDIASTVSAVAGAVSGIPVIGEIASTVGWISDIVGGVSSIFGWSRPNDTERVTALANIPGKYYTHIKAIDNSVALALSNENELLPLSDIFPSAIDEMDLAYVCSNPGVKEVITWSKTDPMNKTLALLEVGMPSFNRYRSTAVVCDSELTPFNLCDKVIDDHGAEIITKGDKIEMKGDLAATIIDTVPCEYVSQLFQYWRATICFKISVVKTGFHTGRLEIFFDPGDYLTSDTSDWHTRVNLRAYDTVDTANSYKYILDLTNDSEITIRVPFISDRLVLSTLGANSYGENTVMSPPMLDDIFDSMIGSLIIRPLTKLMSPETVSDQVKIVVWKWAEDVELMVPKEANQLEIIPYEFEDTPGLSCIKQKVSDEDMKKFLPHWERDGNWICGEWPPTYGDVFKSGEYPKCDTRQATMQINISNEASGNSIDIFQNNNSGMSPNVVMGKVAGERLVNLRPLLRCFRSLGNINVDREGQILSDRVAWERKDYVYILSFLYRFMRGGYRYKFFADDNVQGQIISTIVKNTYKDHASTTGPSHMTYNNLNPVHEIMIPYYSQFRKIPIYGSHTYGDANLIKGKIQTPIEKGIHGELYRSGNDDLTYGWTIGSPQIYVGGAQQWSCYKIHKSTPLAPK